MKKILVVGGVSYNHIIHLQNFPKPQSQTVFSSNSYYAVGGTGAGKALNLCRLGFDVVLHGLLGDDSAGLAVRDFFEKQPMEFVYELDRRGTEQHTNLMEENGGRISIYTDYATFEPELDWQRLERLVAECDVVVLNIINYARKLIPLAQKLNKSIWCDIHDYNGFERYHHDFIKAANYLQFSSDNLSDYLSFMRTQIDNGKQLVVATHGREGASALSGDRVLVEEPIVDRFPCVDTNGAGDAFFSGFMFAQFRGLSLQKSLGLGALVAGCCISSRQLFAPELSVELLQSLNHC